MKAYIQLLRDQSRDSRILFGHFKKSGKQLVQLLIKNIILYDDRMEITFNYTRNRSTENESRGLVVHEGDYTLGEGSEYATDMQVRLKF